MNCWYFAFNIHRRWKEQKERATPVTGDENEAYQDLDTTTRENEHPYQGTIQMKQVPNVVDYQNTNPSVSGKTAKQCRDVQSIRKRAY